MARGDCERDFASAALVDGVLLQRPRLPWLTQRGHLGLPPQAEAALAPLERIFLALSGDPEQLASKRSTPLPSDFVHPPTGTLVEVDEEQHFTSYRLITLRLYPDDYAIGFDIEDYRNRCGAMARTMDGRWAHRTAREFPGEHGRARQRAYNDALRDLAAPHLGHPALVRIAAPDRDGAAAYERVRQDLRARLGASEY